MKTKSILLKIRVKLQEWKTNSIVFRTFSGASGAFILDTEFVKNNT